MKKNKQGFTLIELLAVIVILGVIMAIAIPAMTGYIDDSKKDSMVDSASEFLRAGVQRITVNNMLPVSGTSTYMYVKDIPLSSGGVSPYSNQAYADASVVQATNNNGEYIYTIYLIDGNGNCLTATEKQLNGKPEEKRALIKTGSTCTKITVPDGTTTVK